MIPRFYVYLHAKISKLNTELFIDYFSTQTTKNYFCFERVAFV